MTARRALAVASDALVASAAMELLARGNAVDAVVGGVLAAAGAHAGVLLGPVQVAVGGAGVGLRAVDGRVRQPGRGAQRPRGFLSDQEIPNAARVGVPALPAALAAALASFGKSTAATVFAPAIDLARQIPERARLLERLARRGPSALAGGNIADELVAAAGKVAGGALTEEDLASVRPVTDACATSGSGARRIGTVPWGAEAVREPGRQGLPSRRVHAVAAADAHGVLAVACYEIAEDGFAIPALGLVAPLLAEPVLRGTPRVRPGEPRPAPAPIALDGDPVSVERALAVTELEDAERTLGELLAGDSPSVFSAEPLLGVHRARDGLVSALGKRAQS